MNVHASASLPLAGASVIVTRPQFGNASLLQRVRELGGVPIELPGIGVISERSVQIVSALKQAQACEIVVFISPLAVRFAFAADNKLRFAESTEVFAIGAATAHALRDQGVVDVRYPEQRQDSEGLLALAPLQSLRGISVALIGAAGGRENLPAQLRARGATVHSINVYRRCTPTLEARHFAVVLAAAPPLITLVSSNLALSNLHGALPREIFSRMADNDWVVSSVRLATIARGFGCARVHIAASAVAEAMLETACAALAQHRL